MMNLGVANLLDKIDSFCVQYWITVYNQYNNNTRPQITFESIDLVITEYMKLVPIETIPSEYKYRWNLYEMLKEIVSGEKWTHDFFSDTFQQLTVMQNKFVEEGHTPTNEIKQDIALAKKLCVWFVDLEAVNAIDGDHRKFRDILVDILTATGLSDMKYPFMSKDIKPQQLYIVFEEFPNMIQKTVRREVIKRFCLALSFFHKSLGVPVLYRSRCLSPKGKPIEESSSTDPESPVLVVADSSSSSNSSYQSISDGDFQTTHTDSSTDQGSSKLNNDTKNISKMFSVSRSPIKVSEIVRFPPLMNDTLDDSRSMSISSHKKTKWTYLETKNLIKGVKQYGKQWALIRADNHFNLAHKTNIQLKDRWRNVNK